MEEPKQGKWGLWYADGTGHATKEAALKSMQSKVKATQTEAAKAQRKHIKGLAIFAVAAIALALGAFWWNSGKAERARASRIAAIEKAEHKSKMDALLKCQKAIASVAAYGGSNNPGHTSGRKAGGTWQFLWPQGSFHFKNGFGVEVPQWARCEVDMDSGRIRTLVVSGAGIIGN